MRFIPSLRPHAVFAVAILACALPACGGGSTGTAPIVAPTATAPVAAPTGGTQTPTSAKTSFCITPSTSAQTAAIPSTGGFTGTLSIAAAASAAPSCDLAVTVTTGADVLQTSATARRPQANQATTPILQISLDNAFTNNVEVQGVTLNAPPNLNFPDGTYYAVVTSGTLPSTGLVFTAKNGVLTLSSTGSPILIFPGTTATLALYARGVIPSVTPEPTATPTATASPSATPTATATPTPTAAPTAMPTVTPLPSPTATSAITGTVTLSPAACVAYGFAAASPIYSAIASTANLPSGYTLMYLWSGSTDPSPNGPYTQFSQSQFLGKLSTASTATVNLGPTSTSYGTNGTVTVTLFYKYPSPYGGSGYLYQYIQQPGPQFAVATAYAEVELGLNTCPT